MEFNLIPTPLSREQCAELIRADADRIRREHERETLFDPSDENVHPLLREASALSPIPINPKEGLRIDQVLKDFQQYFDLNGSFADSDLGGFSGIHALVFVLQSLSNRYQEAGIEPTRTPFLVSMMEKLQELLNGS